jgi:hypothetical protein
MAAHTNRGVVRRVGLCVRNYGVVILTIVKAVPLQVPRVERGIEIKHSSGLLMLSYTKILQFFNKSGVTDMT